MRFDFKAIFGYSKIDEVRIIRDRDPILPFETYESRVPSQQNAVDAIDGWVSAFPIEYGIRAGNLALFHDDRIHWAVDCFGKLSDAEILELGPLEGAHTTILHNFGFRITAIEANKHAYLKCLITKEIVGLPNAQFLLGDFVQYLETVDRKFDFIVACGVLYHMIDPLRFLEALCSKTDAIYIWTMFVDEEAGPSDENVSANWAKVREHRQFHGIPVTLYRRGYLTASKNADFSGGIFDEPRWMTRESIIGSLKALGFESLSIEHEATINPYESCFSIFARRTSPDSDLSNPSES